MKYLPLKMKIFLFSFMIFFMIFYMFVFGQSNAVIGLMIAMFAFINLGNDLSYKPKISFIKLLILLLSLGVGAFLNNPISIFGCVLTFVLVFAATFSSYHLFGSDVYLPLLMTYFMMMAIPVTIDELPLRLLSLAFGALFVLLLNILVNRKNDYKLSKQTIDTLIEEIKNAVDLKLDGNDVCEDNFKTTNGFYSSLFSKFQYKYFPSPVHESVLNVVKSFQYIGLVICEYDLSENELTYIKNILDDLQNIDSENIRDFNNVENNEMYLVLLNLEIIANEVKNKDLTKEFIIPERKLFKSLIKPLIKHNFSFKSVKFTFAFKMAFVLTLWEVLTLMFNLPFTKWLYFVSIPLMQPYIDDAKSCAKNRIRGTLIGVAIFMVLMLIYPYLSIPQNVFMMFIMVSCILAMIYKLENKLILAIFTTIMSVMMALMYISPTMAIELKLLWVIVGSILVNLINFGFLPYSVEKESKNNLAISADLNENSINLIKDRCLNEKSANKNTLLVVSNIVKDNIEITDDNRELFNIQCKIMDICNFILSYMDVHEFSDDLKSKLIGVIDNNININYNNEIKEMIILYSMKYVKSLYDREKLILEDNV